VRRKSLRLFNLVEEEYPVNIKHILSMAETDDLYIMGAHEDEVCRLRLQHEVITESTEKLVFAPVDLSQPDLRILDSATADGTISLFSPGLRISSLIRV
jgi:hypothetical protein